ncbi:hypothetical protein GCM10009714_11990 [Microlunatus capsulatus]
MFLAAVAHSVRFVSSNPFEVSADGRVSFAQPAHIRWISQFEGDLASMTIDLSMHREPPRLEPALRVLERRLRALLVSMDSFTWWHGVTSAWQPKKDDGPSDLELSVSPVGVR